MTEEEKFCESMIEMYVDNLRRRIGDDLDEPALQALILMYRTGWQDRAKFAYRLEE